MRAILLILSILFVTGCGGATLTNSVTFTLTDWLQDAYTNRPVTIRGLSTPRTNPPYIAINFLLNTNSGSAGAFTLTNVLDGTYQVTIAGAATPTVFSIYVPTNQGAIHSASSLLTTSIVDNATTAYTKAQANGLFVSRAGTNATLRTNGGLVYVDVTGGSGGAITGSYSFSAVYPLTNNTVNSTSIVYGLDTAWSNGVINTAGLSASNMTAAASNALVSSITSVSNKITNAIVIAGSNITVSDGVTNGHRFFVVNGQASGSGGTDPTNRASTGITITTNNANDHTFAVNTNVLATRAWAAAQDTSVSNSISTTIDARVGFQGSGDGFLQMDGQLYIYTGNEVEHLRTAYEDFYFSIAPIAEQDAHTSSALVRLSQAQALDASIGLSSSNMTAAASNQLAFYVLESGGVATNLDISGWVNVPNAASNAHAVNLGQLTTVSNLMNTARPLAFVSGGVTNDTVAGTNMSATFSFPYAITLVSATLTVREAPVTTAHIGDINTNGVSIFSNTNRLTVPTGGPVAATNDSFNSTTIAAGVRITVDNDLVGASGSGRAPTSTLWYYPQ